MLCQANRPMTAAIVMKATRLKNQLKARVMRLLQVLEAQVAMLFYQLLAALAEDEVDQRFGHALRLAVGEEEERTAERILLRGDVFVRWLHDGADVQFNAEGE